MSRIGRKTAIFVGIGVLALAGAGWVLADGETKSRGKVSWTVVDNDGTEHKETIEFEGTRPFLGVGLERVRDRGGARIDSIEEDSAAERAGLREGDVIVGYDGETIDTPFDLTRAVLKSEPGERVDIEIERDGNRQIVSAELGEREDWVGAFAFGDGFDFDFNFDFEGLAERLQEHGALTEERMERLRERLEEHRMSFDSEEFEERMEQLHESLENMDFNFNFSPNMKFNFGKPRLGVELVGVTGDLREHLGANRDEGVLVGRVLSDTPAEEAGVDVGDLIVAVGGEPVGGQGDLRRLLRERDGETFNLDVIRDGRPMTLTVSLPDREGDDVAPGRYERRHRQREHRSDST